MRAEVVDRDIERTNPLVCFTPRTPCLYRLGDALEWLTLRSSNHISSQHNKGTMRVCISRDSGQNCDGLFVVIANWKYSQVLAGQTET